jgi:ERCC4-type nuclease
MKITEWEKGNHHRLYVNDNAFLEKVYLDLKSKSFNLYGNSEDKTKLIEHLIKNGIHLNEINNVEILKPRINACPPILGFNKREIFKNANFFETLKNNKDCVTLYNETNNEDLSKPPFKASTIKNTIITIDHREPNDFIELFLCSKLLNISNGTLELGDYLFEDELTGDQLIIERKTITDFTESVKGDKHRAHSQAERLYKHQSEMQSNGKRCKIVWIIEGEDQGKRMLYNGLPKAKEVDGMVNYLEIILNQSVIQSFNKKHSVYLMLKMAQGFIEQELFYKVKIEGTGKRIDLSKKDRLHFKNNTCSEEHKTGVISINDGLAAMLSYLPNIKSNAAIELANTNKSFKDIVAMEIDELSDIKFIGKETAIKIYNTFNLIK